MKKVKPELDMIQRKRLLILTFFYPPDFSAGSFRIQALVEELQKRSSLTDVEVITTAPNRYGSALVDVPSYEDHGWLKVHRITVPQHGGGVLGQIKAFVTFSYGAIRIARRRRYDTIFATSSRLMTAFLGSLLSFICGGRLYLDIRDLFVDNINNLYSGIFMKPVRLFFSGVEKFVLRSACSVNVVSPAFAEHIRLVAPDVRISIYTNGVDDDFMDCIIEYGESTKVPTVVYAGNIGDGQGLDRFLPNAAFALQGKANFLIIGDGGAKQKLVNALKAAKVSNVSLVPPVPRSELRRYYRDASYLLMALNDVPAFEKVIPSKLFEYAATGRPILAGVGGFPAQFATDNIDGVFVFKPLDVSGFVSALERAAAGPSRYDRREFVERYSRRKIMSRMAEEILACGDASGEVGCR